MNKKCMCVLNEAMSTVFLLISIMTQSRKKSLPVYQIVSISVRALETCSERPQLCTAKLGTKKSPTKSAGDYETNNESYETFSETLFFRIRFFLRIQFFDGRSELVSQ